MTEPIDIQRLLLKLTSQREPSIDSGLPASLQTLVKNIASGDQNKTSSAPARAEVLNALNKLIVEVCLEFPELAKVDLKELVATTVKQTSKSPSQTSEPVSKEESLRQALQAFKDLLESVDELIATRKPESPPSPKPEKTVSSHTDNKLPQPNAPAEAPPSTTPEDANSPELLASKQNREELKLAHREFIQKIEALIQMKLGEPPSPNNDKAPKELTKLVERILMKELEKLSDTLEKVVAKLAKEAEPTTKSKPQEISLRQHAAEQESSSAQLRKALDESGSAAKQSNSSHNEQAPSEPPIRKLLELILSNITRGPSSKDSTPLELSKQEVKLTQILSSVLTQLAKKVASDSTLIAVLENTDKQLKLLVAFIDSVETLTTWQKLPDNLRESLLPMPENALSANGSPANDSPDKLKVSPLQALFTQIPSLKGQVITEDLAPKDILRILLNLKSSPLATPPPEAPPLGKLPAPGLPSFKFNLDSKPIQPEAQYSQSGKTAPAPTLTPTTTTPSLPYGLTEESVQTSPIVASNLKLDLHSLAQKASPNLLLATTASFKTLLALVADNIVESLSATKEPAKLDAPQEATSISGKESQIKLESLKTIIAIASQLLNERSTTSLSQLPQAMRGILERGDPLTILLNLSRPLKSLYEQDEDSPQNKAIASTIEDLIRTLESATKSRQNQAATAKTLERFAEKLSASIKEANDQAKKDEPMGRLAQSIDSILDGQDILKQLTPITQHLGKETMQLVPLVQGTLVTPLLITSNSTELKNDQERDGPNSKNCAVDNVELSLDLPSLGPIHLKISRLKKEAVISFTTQHEETAKLIDSRVDRLKQAIEKLGLTTTSIAAHKGEVNLPKPTITMENGQLKIMV